MNFGRIARPVVKHHGLTLFVNIFEKCLRTVLATINTVFAFLRVLGTQTNSTFPPHRVLGTRRAFPRSRDMEECSSFLRVPGTWRNAERVFILD